MHGSKRLRVRLLGRADGTAAPGGGEVQMAATAAALRAGGIDARAGSADRTDILDVDCLHLFGSLPSHLPLVDAARRRAVPVVLSTIAWFDLASYWQSGRTPAGRVAACVQFCARALCPRLPSWRRRLYHAVDLLLPNSTAEAEQLMRYFGVRPERIHVVPNGADERFARASGNAFVEKFGVRDFVLMVGRIEPRKNQLGLIRAMRGTGVPVVVLGRAVPGHEGYFDQCRRAAGDEICFVDRFEHDDPLLASAYAACGCLALPSWFETPGLAALEAAMTGTPLVLPQGGCAKEYFGDDAPYVRPGDLEGIRRAVLAALGQPRNAALARRVRESFSWTMTAGVTRDGYHKVVSI